MSKLAARNEGIRRQAEQLRDQVLQRRRQTPAPALSDYPLQRIRDRVTAALRERSGRPGLAPQFDFTSRDKHGADLVIKVPELLREGGVRTYIPNHVPWIAETLASEALSDVVASVQTKGMYVNVRLSDAALLDMARSAVTMADLFGHSDAFDGRRVVMDYSSPNVAKVLHAGHVRSTIIGHVLCNLYDAGGGVAFRVNHLNDFGGFGFFLEGTRRFEQRFDPALDANEQLLAVYAIRRAIERRIAAGVPFDEMPESDRAVLSRYLPEIDSVQGLLAEWDAFVRASNAAFERLEAGDAEEVDRWSRLVDISLQEFQKFYDSLGIHIDFTLGESFYSDAGHDVVRTAVAEGTARVFSSEVAEAAVAEVQRQAAADDRTEAETRARVDGLRKDIGAVVVGLPDGEQLVVLRADGRSIYATRDLGALRVRGEIFDPTDVIYVVGQEQQVHFRRVFQAARVLGVTPESVALEHVWFGFYVDSATGKKLSSRDSVSNVNELLMRSVEHFEAKSAAAGIDDEEELHRTARQLAVGSLVFNDLKQDMKGPLAVDVSDIGATIAGFEQSGGAYVVYAACRARAILRKFGGPVPEDDALGEFALDDQEAHLMLLLQQLPHRVIRAAEEKNPAFLVRHLLAIATEYNSYYFRVPVLKGSDDGGPVPYRLVLTKAVANALSAGLRICHIECPPRI